MFKPAYSSDDFNQTSFNMLRSGTVVDRRMGDNGPEAKINYPDRGLTSDWLPIGSQGSAGTTMFFCPRVGTNVTVAHFGSGVEQGIVLCSNPTGNGGSVTPDSLNSIAMISDDGAQFSYNPDSGELTVLGVKKINLAASGDTVVYTGGNCTAQVGGNLKATVTGSATVTAPTVNVNATGSITLNSPNVTITGTLHVDYIIPFQTGNVLATPHIQNNDGSGGGF